MAQTSRRRILSQLATGLSQEATAGSGSRRSLNDLRQSLRGVHSYLPTPFQANLEINPEGMLQNAAFYAEAGIKPLSLVVAAGLGELFSLGFEEHREVVSAAAAGAAGRLPVVAGVRGGYRFAVRMARNAEEAGADAILIFPPPGGPQTLEGQRQYFTEIAQSVAVGVLIYPRTQRDDWSNLLEELADLPNVMGFKDGQPRHRPGPIPRTPGPHAAGLDGPRRGACASSPAGRGHRLRHFLRLPGAQGLS